LPAWRKICNGQKAWIDLHNAAQGDQTGIFDVEGQAGQELPAMILGVVNDQQDRQGVLDTLPLRDDCAVLGLIERPNALEL
jgi:hypothetical protein